MSLQHKLDELQTIRRLLQGAERLAHAAGDELPGAEHLLLAALDLPDGSARAAFRRAGTDPDQLAAAIEESHDAALGGVGITVDRPSLAGAPAPQPGRAFRATPSAQAAFQRAVELSSTPSPRRLLGAHVVRAVAEAEQGTAIRAIRRLGAEPRALADAAADELATQAG